MSKWLKTKRDGNHTNVRDYLRACGYVVEELFDPLDLIVWRKDGWASFVEVKLEKANASKWTGVQLDFIATTLAPVIIVTSGEQAIIKLMTQNVVTLEQRLAVKRLRDQDRSKKVYTEKDLRDIL